MKEYIGAKIIKAEEMDECTFLKTVNGALGIALKSNPREFKHLLDRGVADTPVRSNIAA